MRRIITILFLIACFAISGLYSQTRIALMPFENMDGNLELNVWCWDLKDSLETALRELDPNSEHFYIVPQDSIDMAVAELNLDPENPQYKTDMLQALRNLKVKFVVSGNFLLENEKFLINGYIFNLRARMRDPLNQARDIFKSEDQVFEAIPLIVEGIKGGLFKDQ